MSIKLDTDDELRAAYPTMALADAKRIHELAVCIKECGRLWREYWAADEWDRAPFENAWKRIDARITRLNAEMGYTSPYKHSLASGIPETIGRSSASLVVTEVAIQPDIPAIGNPIQVSLMPSAFVRAS